MFNYNEFNYDEPVEIKVIEERHKWITEHRGRSFEFSISLILTQGKSEIQNWAKRWVTVSLQWIRWTLTRDWHRESWSWSKTWNVSLSKLFTCTMKIYFQPWVVNRMLPLRNGVRQSKIWCFAAEKNKMYSPWAELISHGQLGSLRFSMNASYLSQWRNIRSLIVAHHFEEDNILYTTKFLKYIFIVDVKFAKRNISFFWPWPWLTM